MTICILEISKMAETPIHPGDFLLEVAELGNALVKALAQSTTYRKVHNRFASLHVTLSTTTDCLTELGMTLNKYENQFTMKVDVTRALAETCKSNFEKLLVWVNEGIARDGLWNRERIFGDENVATEVDPWLLITMLTGSYEETKALWKSLEDTYESLIEMNDVVKYMVFNSMAMT